MNEIIQQMFDTWEEQRKCMLNLAQVDTGVNIARLLVINGDFLRLRQFVADLTPDEYACLHGNESFIRSKIQLCHHEGRHEDVISLIKNGTFYDPTGLLELWDDSHYRLRETAKGQPLTSLDRFRVRKRHSPPPSICPNGRRPTQTSVKKLRFWLDQHQQMPYPTQDEENMLACTSGMSLKQVKTWFANARRCLKKEKRTIGTISSSTHEPQKCVNSTTFPRIKSRNKEQSRSQLCSQPTEQCTWQTRGTSEAEVHTHEKSLLQNRWTFNHDLASEITTPQCSGYCDVGVTSIRTSANTLNYNSSDHSDPWDPQLSSNSFQALVDVCLSQGLQYPHSPVTENTDGILSCFHCHAGKEHAMWNSGLPSMYLPPTFQTPQTETFMRWNASIFTQHHNCSMQCINLQQQEPAVLNHYNNNICTMFQASLPAYCTSFQQGTLPVAEPLITSLVWDTANSNIYPSEAQERTYH